MSTDITGRDGLIIGKALALAIAVEDKLMSADDRAVADRNDWDRLLSEMRPDAEDLLKEARGRLERWRRRG
jgi:hypothetical protein